MSAKSGSLSIVCIQLGPRKLAVIQSQACQVSRIVRVTHAIGSFHTLTRKPGLFSRIFVHAWNRDMASSFTSIRDRRESKCQAMFVV